LIKKLLEFIGFWWCNRYLIAPPVHRVKLKWQKKSKLCSNCCTIVIYCWETILFPENLIITRAIWFGTYE